LRDGAARQEGGMFKNLDYSVEDSDENIRKDVGEYNNHFTRPGDDQDVIFTQPYIGSQGLGTHTRQFISSTEFAVQKIK